MRPERGGLCCPAHEGRTGRKGVPARCGVFFLPERAVRLPWGRFSARESARPLRTARFAVLPGECCHAKRPRIAAGTLFCPRECIDRRAQRLLPPDPANVATQKCPRAAADALFFSRERIERRRQRPLPFCPENVVTQNAPASLRRRFSVRESVSTAALSAFCRPTRQMSPRKNAPRAAGTTFTSEIVPFAARPGERRHAKTPRARRGRFSARESAATAADSALALRPGECRYEKRPRTTRGRFPLHCRA